MAIKPETLNDPQVASNLFPEISIQMLSKLVFVVSPKKK
jgi:hypothetical protein